MAFSLKARKTGAYLFVIAVLATHAFFFWSVRGRIAKGDPDFTVFFTAGKMVREGLGHLIYESGAQQAVQSEFTSDADIRRGPLPYIHPPFEALFFLPLTFLPYQAAFALWNVVNLGLLFVVAWVLRDSFPSARVLPVWQLVLLCLAFFPVFANFHQGQDAILLLLFVTLAFRALDGHKEFAAGCWLGLGVFKYHLILPLVLVLGVWKGRKLVLGFATVGLGTVLLSLGIVGWSEALRYPTYAWTVVSQPAFGGIPYRQLPNLLGLLAGWPFSEKVGWAIQIAALVCTVALLVIVTRLHSAANDRGILRLCFACAVITALLAGYSTNSYDLSLLVLPLGIAWEHYVRDLSGKPTPHAAFIAPAVPLLISPLWFYLWMRWERLNVMAVFLVWWVFAIRGEIRRLQRDAGELQIERATAW